MNEALPIAIHALPVARAAYDKQREATLKLYEAEFKQFPCLQGFPIRMVPSADGDCVSLLVFNAPQVGTVQRSVIRREVKDFERLLDVVCREASPIILVDFKDPETTAQYYPYVLEQKKEQKP